MEQQYRVFDDRNREVTLFAGTHGQAMQFIHDNYTSAAYQHIWMEEAK